MRIIDYIKRSVVLRHHCLLLLFAIAAYWPLSSFQHTTRWDSVETYFPFRYFFSDCLRAGELPLWHPYQLGGYPFYADPQSGAWYPVAWVLCIIAPYTLHMFAIEFILTVFIGAAGMYRLVRSFDIDARIALVAGVSYCACGFFISGAEYISWVVSAAWLPWIFWSYHRMATTRRYGYALLGAVFLFMLLTGGYPSFLAVAVYLLALFFVMVMFGKQAAAKRWEFLRLNLMLGAAFVCISAGALLSVYHGQGIMSRGAALSLEAVNVGPFSPRCLESLLLPFVTLAGDEIYMTDVSMRNAYIGIACLVMLPFAIPVIRRDRKLMVVAILTLFCLAAAFGPYLPVREWLYDFLPGMRYFRLPAFFRIYSIIGAILLAACGIEYFRSDVPANRPKLIAILSVLIGGLIILFAYSVMKHGFAWGWVLHPRRAHADYGGGARAEHLQLQSIIQMGMLGLLLLACLYRRGRYLSLQALIVFCLIDMFLASGLNAFGTMAYKEKRADMEAFILKAPRHFPVPDNSVAVSSTSDLKRNPGLLRTNTSIYFKTPVPDGYNSFLLTAFNRLGASAIHDSVWANPYLYFGHGVAVGMDADSLPAKSVLRVDTADYGRLKSLGLGDVSAQDIRVLKFTPNRIEADVQTADSALLNLQQSYVDGWRMFVDGQQAPIIRTNYTQMAGLITPGAHRVIWSFNPPFIKPLILFTIFSLSLIVGLLTFFRRRLL